MLIDNYVQATVNVNHLSGSVLITKHDSVIYNKTFRTSDYASTKLKDSNSTFELDITSEEFTAAAIHILKDEGKLKLADPK